MELTHKQKARILTTYWGAKANISFADAEAEGTDTIIDHDAISCWVNNEDETSIKIYLKPLSAITQADSIEVAKLWPIWSECAEQLAVFTHRRVRLILTGELTVGGENRPNYEVHQYLVQQGYAVPLLIEPNHPLNGKTAIELGLAVDSTLITKAS